MRPYKNVLKNRLKVAKEAIAAGRVRQLNCICRMRMSITTTLSYWILKLFHGNAVILNNLRKNYIEYVCQKGGDILEIGFGGGITSNMIQTHKIKSHTIIERDDIFFNKLSKWSKNKPNVQTIHGDWISDIPKYKKYDGIFVDLWNDMEDYSRRKDLCEMLERHAKRGTIFICATEKAFEKQLYLDKGYKYEEIKINPPKQKWYNLLSHIIKVTTSKPSLMTNKEDGNIIQNLDLIYKVTFR